ncbi:MAG: AbrB/MazE/SpoVT family DNA-binding domain-containing protein [Clostridia bacterium]|nr:AbrB/MazE/SpoVT family DNA-binding domain-containing protein [Clostridia bacterium]
MLSTGYIRRIDDLGRVVIPKEVRETMLLEESDTMEIFIDKNDNSIILKKYESD